MSADIAALHSSQRPIVVVTSPETSDACGVVIIILHLYSAISSDVQ